MPPYEKKSVERIFDKVENVKNWLSWVVTYNIKKFPLACNRKILVGSEMCKYLIAALGPLHFNSCSDDDYYIVDGVRFYKSDIEIDDMLNPWCVNVSWETPHVDSQTGEIHCRPANVTFDIHAPIDLGMAVIRNHSVLPDIEKVIYNNPATIILWADGTKTIVKKQGGDLYDPEKGLALAIAKKALGNTSGRLNYVLHKWEKKEEPSVPHSCSTCKYNDQKLSKEPCKSCDISYDNWEAEK